MEIHSEHCNCNKLNEETLSFYSYNYTFFYKKKEIVVHVNACMDASTGTPHSEILEKAIRKIRAEEGIKCTSEIFSEVHSVRRGLLRDHFDKGTIVELIQRGGFGYTYFIVHKLDDDFVKENLENLIIV